jgi:hypothetical protein
VAAATLGLNPPAGQILRSAWAFRSLNPLSGRGKFHAVNGHFRNDFSFMMAILPFSRK